MFHKNIISKQSFFQKFFLQESDKFDSSVPENSYDSHHFYPDQLEEDYSYYEESSSPHVTLAATLFTGYDPVNLSTFASEAQHCAVLDTACGSTVCGVDWFETFISQVNPDGVQQVGPAGSASFKFGAGPVLDTLGTYEIPVVLAGVNINLRTDVVNSDIPLLLSKSAIKSGGIVLDMNTDSAIIFGRPVPLNVTSSGHYCVPLKEVFPVHEVSSIMTEDSADLHCKNGTWISDDLDNNLLRLHRQYGHPAEPKLISLLKDAGVWCDSYRQNVKAVYDKCKESGTCRFKHKVVKPVVALPLASDFNDKIAMDLKHWNNKWILHIVDLYSRFTISVFITRKRPTDVIHGLLSEWCCVFGVPKAILTDNGGKFVNAEMQELESMLNIQVYYYGTISFR